MDNHTIIVNEQVPVTEAVAAPKPSPGCCDAKVVWWEPKALAGASEHQAGWTGVANVSIPSRMYWLYNPRFCPMCGTKLPDAP